MTPGSMPLGSRVRRQVLREIGVASAAAALGYLPRAAAAEPPPETTTVRLLDHPVLCLAPQYVAVELLKSEGITDVQYVSPPRLDQALSRGAVDLSYRELRRELKS